MKVFFQLLHIVFCDATIVMECGFVDCEFEHCSEVKSV